MRILIVILAGAFSLSAAQPWEGIIATNRAVAWTNAGAVITNRLTIFTNLTSSATAATINSRLAACPSGQVVFLTNGNYSLNDALAIPSGVTLRGNGADKTILTWTADGSCSGISGYICMSDGSNNQDGPENTATWSAGYTMGTNVIKLTSVANLNVGDSIILDQQDDSSDGYPSLGYIYVCGSAGVCVTQGAAVGRSGRKQQQLVVVSSISGTNVTITPGLYMPNWRSSQNPGAWWASSPKIAAGLEDLTVDGRTRGSNLGSLGSAICMVNSVGCWVTGCRVLMPNNASGGSLQSLTLLYASCKATLRNNYFYGGDNASTSYCVELFETSDVLIENCLMQKTAGIIINGPSAGNVYSYNYHIDNPYTSGGSAPQFLQPMFVLHTAGESMELYEGNQGEGWGADNIHGTHHFQTLFRNHWFGDIFNNPVKTDNTTVIHAWAYTRFLNMVGNVLGRTNYYNTYETDLGSSDTGIYGFGEADGAPIADDDRVKITSMRWGNYDTVTASNHWVSSEVPSTIAFASNSVPASQTLPNSFYLASKPGFWGTTWGEPSWPPIGPDVIGGNVGGYGGRANKIPARLAYENLANDSAWGTNNIKLWSATNFFAGSSVGTVTNLIVLGNGFKVTGNGFKVQ